jgi:hypothetical protein
MHLRVLGHESEEGREPAAREARATRFTAGFAVVCEVALVVNLVVMLFR